MQHISKSSSCQFEFGDLVDLVDHLPNGSCGNTSDLGDHARAKVQTLGRDTNYTKCRRSSNDISLRSITDDDTVAHHDDIGDSTQFATNITNADVRVMPCDDVTNSVTVLPSTDSALTTPLLTATKSRHRTLGFSVRIKQAMCDNAKIDTPLARNLTFKAKSTESEVLLMSLNDASCNNNLPESIDNEVGSFFGLPTKVKELLIAHRSISDLYRMYLIVIYCMINCVF